MGKYVGTFFCDNCSLVRPSVLRTVRISAQGIETVSDTCEVCGVKQSIESTGERIIRKRRIKNAQ